MKNKIFTMIIICFLLIEISDAQSLKKISVEWKGKSIEVVDDEICIKVKKGTNISDFSRTIESLGFEILDLPDNMGMARIKMNGKAKIIETIENIGKYDLIEKIAPIVITYAFVTPNDSFYSNQWGLPKIGAASAWAVTTGSTNITIGVIDTGIPIQNNSLSHSDLQNTNRIILGNDYASDGDGVKDKNGHGTHVAGIASAESNNSNGITGMSWNTKLVIEKVFNYLGEGSDYSFYMGVRDAVDQGAKVINYSGGGMSDSPYFESAIQYARDNNTGVLLVIAAGNYDPNINPNKVVEYPAIYSTEYDNVISVSATTSTDALADYSGRGPEVTVAAPGDGIYSTLPNYQATLNLSPYYHSQNYDYLSGTSMAAPYVSGLAGLLFSKYPSLTPAQVKEIIELSAEDLGTPGFDNLYGYGRINADRTLNRLYVPQEFSTIQSAVSAASSGQTIFVTGSQTISGNITVPSGVTLTVSSVATVNLVNGSNRYSIISTGGTINNQGTITGIRARLEANTALRGYCGSIQTAANYAQQDNEIILEDGNFNENVTISNVDILAIRGGTSYNYKQFGTLTIDDCYGIEGSSFGANSIYMNYDDTSILSNLYASSTNQSGTGLTLYNSGSVDVNYFLADYLSVGIDSYSSDADIDVASILDNTTGIEVWNASDLDVGSSFFCGTGLDLFGYNFSSLTATSCSYDGGTPSISSSGGSSVQSYWNQSCSSPSIISPVKGIKFNKVSGEDPTESKFKEINSSYFSLNKELMKGRKEKTAFNIESLCTGYDEVINDFREFIRNNPDSPLAKMALLNSTRCYRRIGELRGQKDFGEMKNFILEVRGNGQYQALKPQAERLMVDYYKVIGDFTGAVATADTLLGKYKGDEDYACDLIYAKGLILAHDLKQPDKATESFSIIMQQYAKNRLSRLAENELRIMGKEVNEQISIKNKVSASELDVSNYPNPFNPTTNITFTLPQRSDVKLVVYDILGKEVSTLANGMHEAGKYNVKFNGNSFASGTYFYTLTTMQGTISKKMILLK